MIWYVNSATGGDAQDGKSANTAFKTLGHAVELAKAGDTILIAPGTYDQDLPLRLVLPAVPTSPSRCWEAVKARRSMSGLVGIWRHDGDEAELQVAAASGDPARFIDEFRTLLKQSVRLHLASDAPLAAMCSGGMDSSLIAAYAKEELPDMPAYVADIPWTGGEGDQAERVGRHFGVEVRRIKVDQPCFLRLWPHAVWHSDAPSTHPSVAALLAVAQACRADGVKVLLTGEGSDELFGGYDWQRTYNR